MGKKLICLLALVFLIFSVSSVASNSVHDADQDGIFSDEDNCPETYNPEQEDSDNDGIGDVCDPSPGVIIINPEIIINDTPDDEPENNDRSGSDKSSGLVDWSNMCNVNWECSGWSECVDGVKKRTCRDTNNCIYKYNHPAEEIGCALVEAGLPESYTPQSSEVSFPTILLIITSLILVVVLIFLLRKM